jgi:predicted small metal-binding protein
VAHHQESQGTVCPRQLQASGSVVEPPALRTSTVQRALGARNLLWCGFLGLSAACGFVHRPATSRASLIRAPNIHLRSSHKHLWLLSGRCLRSPAPPNKSLKLTRYGTLCKPGLWHSVHHHRPGLQSVP